MYDTRRWLARLAFTFFIIAALLLWQAHQARALSPPPRGLIVLYLVSAALSVGLGIAGVRARHRMLRENRSLTDERDRTN